MPHENNADHILPSQNEDISAIFEKDGKVVSIPGDSSGLISLEDEDSNISISLPNVVNSEISEASSADQSAGISFSSDREEFSTEVFIKEDASVQLVTTIEDSSAPIEYTYDMYIPEGSYLKKSGESILIIGKDGDFLGGVSDPWAFDAEGKFVETEFKIQDQKLIQSVYHKDSSFTYPIKADPYMGKNLIQSVRWVKKAEGFTLQVTPTAWGRAMGSPGAFTAHADELCKRFGECRQHMIWQHQCHVHFAPLKSTWNLDLWKVRSSYAAYVRNLCN